MMVEVVLMLHHVELLLLLLLLLAVRRVAAIRRHAVLQVVRGMGYPGSVCEHGATKRGNHGRIPREGKAVG